MTGIENLVKYLAILKLLILEEESTTTNLLNNPNSFLHSLESILVPTRKCSFLLTRGIFCLQQMEAITENYN